MHRDRSRNCNQCRWDQDRQKIDNEKLMETLGLAIVIIGVLVYLALNED